MELRAIKAGIAEGLRVRSIQRLVGGDSHFEAAWSVTAMVPGSFAEQTAAALFVVLRDLRPRRVVEIGSYLGRSTTFFAKAIKPLVPNVEVIAIDPHTGDRQQMQTLGATVLPSFAVFTAHIEAVGASDIVHPIVQPSTEAALGWNWPIDFLYVDGWHSYDAVIDDGEAWLPHLTPTGIVVFDDFTRYREVHEAVRRLAEDGAFRLWGNVFGQAMGGHGEPSEAARRVLAVANGWAHRHLHRVRESIAHGQHPRAP
jgi:predicted O-methyltransferase YrrM